MCCCSCNKGLIPTLPVPVKLYGLAVIVAQVVELQTKDLVGVGSNPVRKLTSFLIDLSPPVHS